MVGYTGGSGVGTYGGSIGGSGVEGNSTNGYGVYGLSSEGYALYGLSSDQGDALVAEANSGTGVYASSTTGFGLASYANGADAIYTRNTNGNAIDAEGTYIGLLGRSPAGGSTTYPLVLTDQNANDLFWVDDGGNVNYHGGLYQFSRVNGGATVKSFGARTSSPTIEDTGTAQLVNGAAVVRLDSTFAASIDTSSAYRVFLTPDGDTRGLFVASKTSTGFVVRETQGGRATLSFDYRIVATSYGQAGQRMAVASLAGMPHSAQPAAPKRRALTAPAIPATPVR